MNSCCYFHPIQYRSNFLSLVNMGALLYFEVAAFPLSQMQVLTGPKIVGDKQQFFLSCQNIENFANRLNLDEELRASRVVLHAF